MPQNVPTGFWCAGMQHPSSSVTRTDWILGMEENGKTMVLGWHNINGQ